MVFLADNLINGSGLGFPLNTGDTMPDTRNHFYGDGGPNSWVSEDSNLFRPIGTSAAAIFPSSSSI